MSFSEYSRGLRHGYQDQARAVRDILDSDDTDERKIERLRWLVAPPRETGAVIELPDSPDGN